MKNYPAEFKADAVALYESRPDATIRSVAADRGINHQRRYGVKRLCSILGVGRSSFYHWRRTAADRAARQAADARLAARIRAVHQESDGAYGGYMTDRYPHRAPPDRSASASNCCTCDAGPTGGRTATAAPLQPRRPGC